MYSSRLPVPAIGDKAHQPSCFRSVILGRRQWWSDRFSGSTVATVDRARDRWLQI